MKSAFRNEKIISVNAIFEMLVYYAATDNETLRTECDICLCLKRWCQKCCQALKIKKVISRKAEKQKSRKAEKQKSRKAEKQKSRKAEKQKSSNAGDTER